MTENGPAATALPDEGLFIFGDWAEGNGAEITSACSADGSVDLFLPGASHADGDCAIARAVAAQSAPVWRGVMAHERAHILH